MVDKVTKRIRIDFSEAKEGEVKIKGPEFQAVKDKIKKAVGDELIKLVNRSLDKAESPVTGNKFQDLDPKYKKIKQKKGGSGKADIFLTGDQRASITYEEFRDGIEFGVFDSDEADKADNHNKVSSASKGTGVPRRPYIPGKNETFTEEIMQKLDQVTLKIIRQEKKRLAKAIKNKVLKG